jgi:peptidyl-prolyl cis-trans isomerase B (cyclophilin B)
VTPRTRRHVALSLTTAAGAAVTAACGGSSSGGGENPTVGGSPSGTAAASSPCTTVSTPKVRPQHYAKEPPLTIARTTYTARIVTNCGTIVVSLDGKDAPHTVNSFVFLAAHHYFDNTPCHRLTTSGIYVLQCGDPTGTGSGGPGYTLPEENLKGATYSAGTVAMARTPQPHSGGSQFFFVYANSPLPAQYTPFGRVVQGLDVLKAIAAGGEDDSNSPGDGRPTKPVVIETFRVTKG